MLIVPASIKSDIEALVQCLTPSENINQKMQVIPKQAKPIM